MRLTEKINLPKYIILSLISSGVLFSFTNKSLKHGVVILVLMLAISVNQMMLSYGVVKMTESAKEPMAQKKRSPWSLVFLFIGKLVILAGALILGIQFMDGLVLIPLLSYIFQMVILMICFKRN